MVDSITSIFAPKQPRPDPEIAKQRETAEAERLRGQKDLSKRRRALLAGRGGRRTLFSGPETGTNLKTTLG